MKIVIKKHKSQQAGNTYMRTNVCLALIGAFLLIGYIAIVQYVGAAEYRLSVFKRKADQMSIEVASYQRNIDLASSPAILQTFALTHDLVPVRDSVTIYPQKNIAFGERP